MHAAQVISCRPTTAAPANAPHFTPRMRAYDITCRLPGSVETIVTTIAPDSCIAVDYCQDAYECLMGVSIKTVHHGQHKGA